EKKIANQRESNWKELGAKTRKQLHKTIELLEMRLRHVTVCYNAVVARNNKLREETASLQIQKASFDNLYWKLERSLVQQNKLLNAAIEQSCSLCRMEDLGRISDIRDVRYRETIQYNIRLLERKCALHQESRLKNFFLSKCADLSVLKEQAKAREGNRGGFESYEVAYKRLLELSDGNIDDFLEDFLEKDRRFFILFNFAIRLNVRNESLRQRIEAVQVCSCLSVPPLSRRRNSAVFSELNAKIAETTKEANKYENKYRESSQLLGQIQSRIETLLKEMDCDTTKIVKPLGDSLVPVFGRSGLPIFLCLHPGKSCPPPAYTVFKLSFCFPLSHQSLCKRGVRIITVCVRGVRRVTVCFMGYLFPWVAEEPLGREELRELVIQRQQEEVSRPPSTGKKKRKFTSPGGSGSPSGSKTPAGN
uniref:ODAD1 central coiled coil region domain-containing protein n=1 Tax=Junco hyemalis TaxID=40217 RepID=A0A8C5J484_JUNHY